MAEGFVGGCLCGAARYDSLAPSWDHIDRSLPVFAEMPEQSPAEIIDGMNN